MKKEEKGQDKVREILGFADWPTLLVDLFTTEEYVDSNGNPANIVEALFAIAEAINRLATLQAMACGLIDEEGEAINPESTIQGK